MHKLRRCDKPIFLKPFSAPPFFLESCALGKNPKPKRIKESVNKSLKWVVVC